MSPRVRTLSQGGLAGCPLRKLWDLTRQLSGRERENERDRERDGKREKGREREGKPMTAHLPVATDWAISKHQPISSEP